VFLLEQVRHRGERRITGLCGHGPDLYEQAQHVGLGEPLDDPVAAEVQDRDAGQRDRRYRLRACAGRDESGNVTDRAVTMSHPSGWVGSPLPGSALTSVNELTSFTNALHNLNGKRC
jgi:hypothetical protein